MHKRLLPALAVLCLIGLVVAAPAHAVYVDSSWYAQVTNAAIGGNNPFPGYPTSSQHIAVTGGSGTGSFSIPQSGQATMGEIAYWGNGTTDPMNTIGPLSFDYTTYWTQPNLVLQVSAYYLDPNAGPGGVVWSSSRTGLRASHVTINANPNGYWFEQAAVPEPNSIIALGSLCGLGIVPMLGRRRV